MKKLATLGLIMVVTLSASAVNPLKQQWMGTMAYSKPFMTFDLSYTPFFIGRNLSPMALDKSYTETFSHEFSYSTGLNIGIHVKKSLMIQAGCWYSARTYLSETEGTFSSGNTGRIVTRYMPNYLSIPLSFKIILREKIGPFFKIGAVADMLSSYNAQSNFFGTATFDDMAMMAKTKEQFETMRYSLALSFGLTMGSTRKSGVYVQLEPTFLYSLSNDSEVFSSAYRPFYYGLSISLGYNMMRKEKGGEYDLPGDYEEEAEPVEAE